jgi:hypothetical protein
LARNYTKWAVQEALGWQEFEDVCVAYLFCAQGFRHIRQAGRVGDQGRDAVVLLHDQRERVVFAFSKEQSPLSGNSAKFFRDYDRWRGSGIERFVFVSSKDLGANKIDLPKGLDDPPVDIYDITDLVRFLDLTPEGLEVKRQHGLELAGGVMAVPQTTEQEIPLPASRFTVLSLEDASHAAAKRYTANILIPPPGSREHVRPIVAEAVAAFRSAEIFRNDITKRYWAGQPAQAVWLFVYQSLDDVPHANWICRCQWLSTDLAASARPMALKGDETLDGIVIGWNEQYQARSEFARTHTVSHANFLDRLDSVMARLEPLMTEAQELYGDYLRGKLDSDAYVERMRVLEPEMFELYRQSGDIGFAPTKYLDLSSAFQQLMATAHNVVLPFSERGLKTWQQRNRDYLVRSAVERYLVEVEEVRAHRQRANS